MIPEEKVREVADRISIVEVVSEYVQLRRSGANFSGLCPFHAEKTPSFNVNPAREIFHCFGCGAGGNAFSFIMRIEGVSFPEAVKMLARKAGVVIEERQLSATEKQAQSERQDFMRINDLAAAYYRTCLTQKPDGTTARRYLEQRQAFGEIAETYRLGFAPDRGDALTRHLLQCGVNLEIAGKLGLVRKGERGWYDQLRNRLIFPIRDAKGNTIAFAGRVLDGSLPKYINSPESPVYHKSSVLFGLDMALPSIRLKNSVIIVEGYFDHLALYRAGIRNVVATCGTALTAHHASLLKRHASRVYTLFDSDGAGQKATIKAMEVFLEQRLPAYVISLPQGDDPDSFLAVNTAEAFQTCQDKALPVFEFFIRSLLAQTPPRNVDSKVRVIDDLLPNFKKIADPAERDLYEKEICRLLDISPHAFRKRLGGMTLVESDSSRGGQSYTGSRGDAVQETLLSLLCWYPEARLEAAAAGLETLFDGQYLVLARLVSAVADEADDIRSLSLLADRIDSPDTGDILSRILVSDDRMAGIDWRAAFASCRQSREKRAIIPLKEIITQLATLPPDSAEYTDLLRQAESLRTRKAKIQP